jgi:hypothetical protein
MVIFNSYVKSPEGKWMMKWGTPISVKPPHWWIEPWSNISNMFLAFFLMQIQSLVSRHYLYIFDILYPFYPRMWCHNPTSFREAFRSSSEAGGLIPRMFIGVWWCMCICWGWFIYWRLMGFFWDWPTTGLCTLKKIIISFISIYIPYIWVNYNSPNLKCWAILGMIPRKPWL